MKTACHLPAARAFSLIEVTLVIGLMLTLAGIVAYTVSSMSDWKNGRDAAEKLRAVYLAQKSFLADQPAKDLTTFTEAEIIPYLPGNPGAMPTQTGNDGEALVFNIQVMPPTLTLAGSVYDPSASPKDGLWDVGGL